MIRKTLIASAVILCGTVGFTSAAKADSTTVDMTGDVAGSCTFGTVTPGILEINGDGTALVTTTTGSVPVTCNTTGTLTLDGVTDTNAFTGYDSNNVDVTLSVTGGTAVLTEADIAGAGTGLDQTTTTLTIDLTATENAGGVLPAGTGYTYGVQLTATAN